MKLIKLSKIRLTMSIIILALMMFLNNCINLTLSKDISNVLEYKKMSKAESGVTFGKLQEAKLENEKLKITGCKETAGSVLNASGVSSSSINSKVVLTDENYFRLYPHKIIKGGFIDALSVKNGSKAAVISEDLAVSLFKDDHVVGSTINIDNKKYKVIGVYREDKSLLYRASEDGYDRVYIPYTSYKLDSKDFLDSFSIEETSSINDKIIAAKLSKALSGKISSYTTYNYSISKVIVSEYVHIMYFILGAALIVFILMRVVRSFKEIILFIKSKLKEDYLSEVLRKNLLMLSFMAAELLIYIVCIFLVFNLVKFNIVAIDKYLPYNNIFDFNFYKEALLKNIQLKNANEAGISNVYDRFIERTSSASRLLLLGEVIAFLSAMLDIKSLSILKGVREEKNEI